MPTNPTFAEQMVTKLQDLLLANPGATSVSFDGQVTSYADLESKLAYWQKRVDRESTDARPTFYGVNLSGGSL